MNYVSILAESVGDVAIIRLNDQKSLEQLARDRIVQRAMGHTADHGEGIAAFFDKRPAIFTGN
jgi:hypothetical protein